MAKDRSLERSLLIGLYPELSSLFEHSDSNMKNKTFVRRPGGKISTVYSATVTDPRINAGMPTLIPTIWNGAEAPLDLAIINAIRSKKAWPKFPSIDVAGNIAEQASMLMGE